MKTISKNFLYFLYFLFLFSICSPCSAKLNGPFFWKAKKDGKTMHILGTMHVAVGLNDLQCSQNISNTLKQSSLLWLEVNTTNTMKINQAMLPLRFDGSGQSFNNLNETSQNFLKSKFPLTINDIKHLNYFGLKTQIQQICMAEHRDTVMRINQELTGNTQVHLDNQVQELAKLHNIEQNYLDGENHLEVIVDWMQSNAEKVSKTVIEEIIESYKEQCTKENIENLFSEAKNFHTYIVEQYLLGEEMDFEILEPQLLEKMGLTEEAIKESVNNSSQMLFNNRNKKWLKTLLSAHTHIDNMFVAAGVGHFQGQYSILDMLQREGFFVQRMNLECTFD